MSEKQTEKSHIPTRLNVLFLIVFLFFAAIILRLAYVQLVEGEQYKHDLEKYSTRELPIPAPRGRILDRNGEVLVSNKPVYTVTFVEEQNKDINEDLVADKLAGILRMDDEKPSTDKDLLKKALDLKASLPVTFGDQETQQLIAKIAPKIMALPQFSAIDTLSDGDLVKTAISLGMRVNVPIPAKDRDALQKAYVAQNQKGTNTTATNDISDVDLLKFAFQTNKPVKLTLDSDARDDLKKELKAQMRTIPDPGDLAKQDDMKLLKLASMFDIDVPLPLTPDQRAFQWRKMAILKEMRAYGIASYIPRRIKVNISPEEMFRIEERRTELPGIDVIVEPIRQIRTDPDGSPFATHILGYINAIRPEQLNEYMAQGYSPTERVGENGLERYYERQLRGKDGVMDVHVNKDSQTVEKKMSRAPEPGNDLILALDWRFQSKVEDILKNALIEMQHNPATANKVKDVHALVMNPKTGEILAMASAPDYDLNLYYDRKKFNEVYSTQILPNESNKFINGFFAPGSTAKMLSVMLSLQEHLTTPDETIMDRGGWQVGNMFKRNWKLSGHGAVNARRALQVSNNTYMYAMSMRLADRGYSKYGDYKPMFHLIDFYNQQFGLGVKTGVDLPFESSGYFSKADELGRMADAFIGQYNSFTPMQLGQYISTIANGGYRIRPHFVDEIRKGTIDPKQLGQVLTEIDPEVLNRPQIDPQWIKVVQEGMHMVTLPGGTAYTTFRGLPFNVAAKTGTAQTGGDQDNALIAGYAPYEDPQLAFVVIVPKGGHGADSSGPIARQILDAYNSLYPGALTSAGAASAK
ncbi:peptidoglycan D,D-transpeptidase FtsI family protein [Brevibacillus ginsengisoli]|uniref:peptidoglycan D,D-transpeptidase FtsI family protein n=1 Tax=Brevibacillus ginsengisoli TaxID=363854 RepID=UPI003CF95B60